MKLTCEAVNSLMMACLYSDNEVTVGKPPPDAILVEGVIGRYGFDPKRVSANKEKIVELTKELPETFDINIGGGWSFLNMPMDKDGRQWGEQYNAEHLLCLAIAAGVGGYSLPREMWAILPGNVPYVWFGERNKEQAKKTAALS